MRSVRSFVTGFLGSLLLVAAAPVDAQTFLVGETLTPTTLIAPLGQDPPPDIQRALASAAPGTSNVSLAAFRVQVTLPAGVVRSLPGGRLQIAIEIERILGVPSEQTPVGFPRSQLRAFREDGVPETRPITTLAMDSLIPAALVDAQPALRFQRAGNRFVSPWIIAIADPRASMHYPWPAGVSKAAMGCRNCERPAHLRGKTEADGVFEIYTNGRFIRARPELRSSGGPSIFAETGYAYLGQAGRMEARIRTYMADTVYPADDRLAAITPPAAVGPTEELYYPHTGAIEYSATDYALKGRAGLDVVVSRTYSSAAFRFGPFGRNMDSPLLARVRPQPDGSVDYFDGTGRVAHFAASSGAFTPPLGVFLDLSRTAEGAYVLVYADRTTLRFDEHGRLLSIADRNTVPSQPDSGNQTRLIYNAQGLLSTIIDATRRRIEVTYHADRPWLVEQLRDFDGRTVTYEYDAAGRLTTVAGPAPESPRSAQQVLTYAWATAPAGTNLRLTTYQGSQLLSVTDGLGRTVAAMTYQPLKPWSAATVAMGGGTWEITAGEPELAVVDPRGFTWKYTHDNAGNITHVTAPPVVAGGPSAVTVYEYDGQRRLQSVTRPLGERTIYTYGTSGEGRFRKEANVTQVRTVPRAGSVEAAANLVRTSTIVYGTANLPTHIALADGATTGVSRDERGNATAITDASGVTITAQYDTRGLVSQVSNPRSETTTFDYHTAGVRSGYLRAKTTPLGTTAFTTDPRGNVVSIQDAAGNVTSFDVNRADQVEREARTTASATYEYDAAGNVKEHAILVGLDDTGTPITSTTAYSFDALGRLATAIEDGRTTTHTYDPAGNLLSMTAPGDAVSYTFDARNRIATERRNGRVVAYQRDEADAITRATDGRGKSWSIAVNGFGRSAETTDPYGITTIRALDAAGRERDVRVVKTLPGNRKLLLRWSVHEYDVAGRLVTDTVKLFRDPLVIGPDGSVSGATDVSTTYVYDDAARRHTVTDAAGNRTVTDHDEYGRPLRVTDAAGNILAYEYTENGNRRRVTRSSKRPDGSTETQVVLYVYDRENRVSSVMDVSDPTNAATTDFTYDARGNIATITDPDRNVTTYGHDRAGNRDHEVDAAGGETTLTYDEAGRVLTVKDANGRTLTSTYTADGAIETETRADGSTWRYGYDENGNRTSATHPTGTVIAALYDDANRLVEETITRGGGVAGPTKITYVPDDLGRVTSATTSEGVKTTFAYDSLDRVRSETVQVGDGPARTVRAEYDATGMASSIEYPSGLRTDQTYSPLHLLETVEEAGAATPILRYGYVGDRVAEKTLASGVHDEWRYDPSGRLNEMLATAACASDGCVPPRVRHVEYGWSRGGAKRRVGRPDLEYQTEYDYTPTYAVREERLEVPLVGDHPQPRVRVSYELDPVLNQQTVRRSVASVGGSMTVDRAFGLNARNQYTEENGVALTYDRNGNLRGTASGAQLEYDYANRLKRVSVSGAGDVEFLYDARGRMVGWRGLGEAIDFVPREDRVLEEYRNGAIRTRFIYGRGVDELARVDGVRGAPTDAAASVYPLQDELGTVERLLDPAGSTIERYAYEGYGGVDVFDASGVRRGGPGVSWNRFFQGRPRLPLLDAYDFRARTLWVGLGRFGQEDPAGASDSPNLYQAFKARWPVLSDPFGESIERGQIVAIDAAVANLEEAAKNCKTTDARCVIAAISASHRGFGAFNSDRYIFTERGGWLDLRHLYELASQQVQRPDSPISIERVGELIEEDQAVVGHPSAFSFEDLPTNHRGVTLGRYLLASKDAVHTVRTFLRSQLAAARTFEDSLPLNPIINLSVQPILSARDPLLARRGPWTYRPSGYPARDRSWLKMMDEGLKKNPQRREVPTSDPESLVMAEALRVYGPTVLKTLRW